VSPREAAARAGTAAAALAHPARPAAGGAPGRTGSRLTVVPRGAVRPPRAPFVLLVGALLVGGLAGLLALNTTLQQGSFTLQDLQQRSSSLQDQEQALAQSVAVDDTPQRLANRAAALGMVPSVNPVFIRISDGRILGRPEPGKAVPRPRPAPRATTAVPKPGATAAARPGTTAATTKATAGTATPRPRPTASGTTAR
jgi:hypothetical protein